MARRWTNLNNIVFIEVKLVYDIIWFRGTPL